jgi:hypothetical protein
MKLFARPLRHTKVKTKIISEAQYDRGFRVYGDPEPQRYSLIQKLANGKVLVKDPAA